MCVCVCKGGGCMNVKTAVFESQAARGADWSLCWVESHSHSVSAGGLLTLDSSQQR